MSVKVSYLTTSSGPTLWGAVGSLVTEPGEGRYVILRRVVPERGAEGYFIVDLVSCSIVGRSGYFLETESEARETVLQIVEEREAKKR